MVERFGAVARFFEIVALVGAVVSEDIFQDWFESLELGTYERFYWLGPAVLGVVGLSLSGRLAEVVLSMRWLRSLLAGSDDIEGDWVNIVARPDDPTSLLGVEYCRIFYKRGRLRLTGETWNMDGQFTHSHSHANSSFSPPTLEYFYHSGNFDRVGGYGRMTFYPEDDRPTSFVCKYIDEETTGPIMTIGERVSTKQKKVPRQKRLQDAMDFADEYLAGRVVDHEKVVG